MAIPINFFERDFAKRNFLRAAIGRIETDVATLALSMQSMELFVAAEYLTLGGAYLVVLPVLLLFLLKARWYIAGSIERVFLYFLVFFFFPGLLLLAPFFNFRPERRTIPN
jgi:NAD(P)H-quinone oxidoreductase subunit L